jgi:hypothetical protein
LKSNFAEGQFEWAKLMEAMFFREIPDRELVLKTIEILKKNSTKSITF